MPNRPDKSEDRREQDWARTLERARQQHLRPGGQAFFDDAPQTETPSNDDGSNERNWANQLERGRMRNLGLSGGLALPGPGAAAAATAPAIGKPISMPMSSGKQSPATADAGATTSGLEPQAPSSLETAKVAAQIASGVGLGAIAGEEFKKIGLAATKGIMAAASALWSFLNKYGLWLLFFGVYCLVFEDPFFTTPALLALIWVWAVAAHWWPQPKWLRKLNVLEWLILIVTSAIYAVAAVIIFMLISAVVCAMDTSCAMEIVQEFGLADALSLIQ